MTKKLQCFIKPFILSSMVGLASPVFVAMPAAAIPPVWHPFAETAVIFDAPVVLAASRQPSPQRPTPPPYNDGPQQGRPRGDGGGGIRVFPTWPTRPPIVVEDDEPEYRPRPPKRRPRPVIEEDDDESVVRRPRIVRSKEVPQKRVSRRVAPKQALPPPPVARAQPRVPKPPLPIVSIPSANERRLVHHEVLLELKQGASADALIRRHRLVLLSTDRFVLANSTILRMRIEGGRTARRVLAEMAGDARIASAQPNYVYALQQEAKPAVEGVSIDTPIITQPITAPPLTPQPILAESAVRPAVVAQKPQYALSKIGIEQAHLTAQGVRVRIAVIDTGVDDQHPDLAGAISQRFNAIEGQASQADDHGTAMAGAIAARGSLKGVSPAADLLVARAFAGAGERPASGAEGTTFHILKSLDWAHGEGARVVNLSFAGPQDRLLSRSLEGGRSKGMIAVAAAGNAGPTSAPLYPGADPSVITVTATDADDNILPQANRGAYIAVAAPGVDIIGATPAAGYGFSSGTSIAAAHVSGLIALMLEHRPDLDFASVRNILTETAIDLGKKGHDPIFGAGRVNAPAALVGAMNHAPVKK